AQERSGQVPSASCQRRSYRLAAPRTIFFTLRFFEPRAYSRGFNGFSAFTFLRDVRFAFLRSSLLSFLVLAISPLVQKVKIKPAPTGHTSPPASSNRSEGIVP